MRAAVIFLLSSMLNAFTLYSEAATWFTVSNGNWNDSTIWLTGVVPPYSFSDTIYIRDTVHFNQNLVLNVNAFLRIDSYGGALCGHNNITMKTGAQMNKFGALCFDTLFITGGLVNIYSPEVFGREIEITGGEFQFITGISFNSWTECFVSDTPDTPTVNSAPTETFEVFPNPNAGNFSLQYTQQSEHTFYLFNALGQNIFVQSIKDSNGVKKFLSDYMANGVYFWKVVQGENIISKGKIVIEK